MASKSQKPDTSRKKHSVLAALHILEKGVQPLLAFRIKFNNDWSWNNAAGLAFNLILAVFPIVITLLSILGFFLNTLDPGSYQSAIEEITSRSSALREAKPIVAAAFQQVRKDASLLGAIAVVLALFNGSRPSSSWKAVSISSMHRALADAQASLDVLHKLATFNGVERTL